MAKAKVLMLQQQIEQAILIVRGHKVMLDSELASLYGVTTKALNQAVKRNADRFPEDFMMQLTWEEARLLRSQTVTLNEESAEESTESEDSQRGKNVKYRPYVFTEQGVAMLSSVLRSARAIEVNIEIMRAFVRMRSLLATQKEMSRKLEQLERRLGHHDEQIKAVFDAIRQLMAPPPRGKKQIGFKG